MPREHRIRLVLAFAVVYLVWGSTFLSIRYAIATIPPHLMAALRYASAGAILVAIARLRARRGPHAGSGASRSSRDCCCSPSATEPSRGPSSGCPRG